MKKKINKVDGVFKSILLSKFIKHLYTLANSSLIFKSIYTVFYILKKKLNCCPIFFFFEAIEKIRPIIGVKLSSKKKIKEIEITFASIYILRKEEQYNKAIFWLYKSVSMRKEKSLIIKIFNFLFLYLFSNIYFIFILFIDKSYILLFSFYSLLKSRT